LFNVNTPRFKANRKLNISLRTYAYDANGNTRVVYHTNATCSGTSYVLDQVNDYYPFGKSLREFVNERERYTFNGNEREEESGLDYFNARYYDADVCRFWGVDPIVKWHESGYAAFGNNPIYYTDPSGLDASGDPVRKFTVREKMNNWTHGRKHWNRANDYAVRNNLSEDQVEYGTTHAYVNINTSTISKKDANGNIYAVVQTAYWVFEKSGAIYRETESIDYPEVSKTDGIVY
jgi:RHS repeat-associated protein